MGAAAIVSAAAAVLGAGYGAYSGEQASSDRRRARRSQEQAQGRAARQAEGQRRQGEIAENRENQRLPDLASLLSDDGGGRGSLATLLSGPGGIDPSQLTLGRRSLLA